MVSGNGGAFIYPLIVSSNMAKANVIFWMEGNKCPMDGMVFFLMNENDETDCLTKYYATDHCDELVNVRNNSIYI